MSRLKLKKNKEENTKTIIIPVPERIHREFKLYSVKKGVTMRSILLDFISSLSPDKLKK